jgi:hypothetical protein
MKIKIINFAFIKVVGRNELFFQLITIVNTKIEPWKFCATICAWKEWEREDKLAKNAMRWANSCCRQSQ